MRQVEADDKRRVVSTMGLIPARSAMAKVSYSELYTVSAVSHLAMISQGWRYKAAIIP